MSNRNRRIGFAKTHQTCPCPLHETRCFSTFTDDPSSGYCFACSEVKRGPGSLPFRASMDFSHTLAREQKYVSTATVMESTGPVLDFVSTFSNIEGHREALTAYAELRSSGEKHYKALKLSGYLAIAQSRLHEMRDLIVRLPSFFQQLIFRTNVPDILSAFHIGRNRGNEVIFWVADSMGRICNGQVVAYSGLSRCVERSPRYAYRTADGYVVSSFFGAEQLQPGYTSWTQQPFATHTPVFIVESPKSVPLGSLICPQVIWVASCGASGVTESKARALRGREVGILFDNDSAGSEGARRAVKVLIEAGAFARIVEPRDLFGGVRPEGWDIGDEALNVIGEQP